MFGPEILLKTAATFILGMFVGFYFRVEKLTIREYERGLLFKNGKFIRLLEAGRHSIAWNSRVNIIDMRPETYMVHQNILTSDNIHIGINLKLRTKVAAPYKAFTSSQNFQHETHDLARSVIKEIGKTTSTKIIVKEDERFEKKLEKPLREALEAIGMELLGIELIDANLPHNVLESIANNIDLNKKKEKPKKVGFLTRN